MSGNNARWSGQMRGALLAIPSISLVTDLENLFGSSTGIYVNATNRGISWERPATVAPLPFVDPGKRIPAS